MPGTRDHKDPGQRLESLLATFGAATRALVLASDQEELAAAVTGLLVADGAFSLAWISADPNDEGWIEPMAAAGDTDGYLAGNYVPGQESPDGADPVEQAIRSGIPFVCPDIAHDLRMEPWSARCLAHGHRAFAAFPLHSAQLPTAVLNVFAPVAGVLGALETGALADLARAVGVAFDRADLRPALERNERLEAVSRVAATAGHDFGNVLMAISLFQGFIEEGLDPSDPLQKDAVAIGEAVERGRDINTQLLAVGREAPDGPPEPVDALELLQQIEGVLRAIASPASLRVDADLDDVGGPPLVHIRRRDLEHALLNLVMHAADPMTSRAGHVTVTVGVETVLSQPHVGLAGGRYLTLTVACSGTARPRADADQGLGRALSSVARTAQRVGGTMRTSGTPGAGDASATVTLLLPLALAG